MMPSSFVNIISKVESKVGFYLTISSACIGVIIQFKMAAYWLTSWYFPSLSRMFR